MSISENTQSHDWPPPQMTLADAARYSSLPVSHLKRAIRQGKLKCRAFGGNAESKRVRVRRVSLEALNEYMSGAPVVPVVVIKVKQKRKARAKAEVVVAAPVESVPEAEPAVANADG